MLKIVLLSSSNCTFVQIAINDRSSYKEIYNKVNRIVNISHLLLIQIKLNKNTLVNTKKHLNKLWLLKTFPSPSLHIQQSYIVVTQEKVVKKVWKNNCVSVFHYYSSMPIDIVSTYSSETKEHLKSVWIEIIKFLNAKEDAKKIVTFLAKCAVIGIDEKENVLHVGIPNEFVFSQVKKFFKKTLTDAVHQTYNKEYSLNLEVLGALQEDEHDLHISLKKYLTESTETKTPTLDVQTTNTLTDYFGILFEKKYTFENFVVWSTNELAAWAAQAIAEKPGEVYNPFFIYGDVWLGKTHLMQAIGNHIIQHAPEKVIVYLPCTKFIDQVIHAIRQNKIEQLKQKLEEVDVLMIDDIQFLAGKDKTQEIFHNIFNDFYAKGKQLVMTSDEPPKALTLLEPRLQSRFALWLVVDIKAPDLETRIAILQSKALKKDFTLDQRHAEIVAESVFTNVRELEWALNIIITKTQLLKRDLTDQDIFDALDTLGIQDVRQTNQAIVHTDTNIVSPPPIASNQNWLPITRDITNTSVWAYEIKLANIANYYGLEIEKIKGNSRTKEISFARQCAMYIAKTQFNWSLQKIWTYFGGKNHSSVIYAIRTFEKNLKSDALTTDVLKQI